MALSNTEALDRFRSNDLIGLGMEADAVRRRLHPEGAVSYTMASSDSDAQKTPTASAVAGLAAAAAEPVRETLLRLQGAGVESLSGQDGAVLPIDPAAISMAKWLEVHRTAHLLGIVSTPEMVFGCGETIAQRVAYLEALAALQQETGGFLSLTPIVHRPANRAHLPEAWEEATAVEYLRTLAVARVMLDGIPNLVADSTHQGLKVIQMALRFGPNDAGSIGSHYGNNDDPSVADLRRVIRDAGLRPVERDAGYRICYLTD